MHWKLKSKITNAIALLPSTFSYASYYWLQRRFGGLRQVNPSSRFAAAIETWKRIQDQQRCPAGKIFLEVGTGWAPVVPIAYWLMGAKRVITVDVNPYLKEELIAEHLGYISRNSDEIATLFGTLMVRERLDALLDLARRPSKPPKRLVDELLDLCQITYIAPGDAAKTGLPDRAIDFHTSYTVFEHISPRVLTDILEEGGRIVKRGGLFIHFIDYSDHFSHSDSRISAINFLKYSDEEWEGYAGNRYMYMNRLRHDDFLALYQDVGHDVIDVEVSVDKRAQNLLETNSLVLSGRFNSKTREILAVTGAWVLTTRGEGHELGSLVGNSKG